MSTANSPTVEFTETGAIYRPGNGQTIHYRRVNSIFFHAQTPDAVVQSLESARSRRQRVRLYYGDFQTGRDWLEEHDVEGIIGNSMGPLRVPLLIHMQTGEERPLGDGVDTLFDADEMPISPGTPCFCQAWAEALNADECETLEAYFPELHEKESRDQEADQEP
jgi:hypothetical protein